MLNGQPLVLLIGMLSLFSLSLGIWQSLVSRRLRLELGELKQFCDSEMSVTKPPVKASFAADLTQVERRRQDQVSGPGSAAEKYRYVSSLAEQGLAARAIADALQLAPAEVEQLLQLAKLKRTVQGR